MNPILEATQIVHPAVTVFTTGHGLLCKQFHLSPTGELIKTPVANMASGRAEHVYTRTPRDLAMVLDSLRSDQAVSIGVMKNGAAAMNITTVGAHRPDAISRSKANFHFPPDEPAWLLIDYDTDQMPDAIRQRIAAMGGPWQALRLIWPELDHSRWVVRGSSSAGVVMPDGTVTQSDGLHAYIQMRSGVAIPETIKTLGRRAWLHGLGWIKASKSGDALVRSIVDTSVGSPERLIFEAAPSLGQGLTRQPTWTQHSQDHGGLFLGGLKMTPQEQAQADLMVSQATEAMRPELARIRVEWTDAQVTRVAKRANISNNQARKIVTQMMQGALLDDKFQVTVKDGSFVLVGDILDHPDQWHRKSVPDPIEGIEYGNDKATFFLKPRPTHPTDRPVLISHAHGIKTVYRFARYETPPPPVIPPFYQAPVTPRDEAIAAHGQTIRNWMTRAANDVRAARAVKEFYAVEEDEYLRACRVGEIMAQFGLTYTPRMHMASDLPLARVMLTGAQGVGKTAYVLAALEANPDITALVLMPDHEMAAEAAMRFNGTSLIMRGRDAVDPDADDKSIKMCRMSGRAKKVINHGLSVRAALCDRCPHSGSCAYLRQAADLEHVQVIFAPHDWAFLPLPNEYKPDVVIFDERPRDFGIDSASIPVERLQFGLQYDGGPDDRDEALAIHAGHIGPLMHALRYIAYTYPFAILAALRSFGWTREHIETALAGLDHFEPQSLMRLCRDMVAVSGAKSVLDDILNKPAKPIRALRMLFRALADEIDLAHNQPTTVRFTVDKQGVWHYQTVTLRELINGRNRPFLHLDGTGDPELMRLLFGQMKTNHHPIERNAIITQVIDQSFSKSAVTGENRTDEWLERSHVLQGKLRDVIHNQHPDAAIFSYMDAAEPLGLTDNERFGYFNAIRGLNQWEDYPAGIVIGRNQPKPVDVEQIAAAYAVRAGVLVQASQYVDQWRGVRLRNGSAHPLSVQVHPDFWAQRVLEQMREREIEQTLDRLRLIHNPIAKEIHLLSPVVIDATVDQIKSSHDYLAGMTRIEKAIYNYRFVPLSGREATRIFPDIWASEATARRDLDEISVINAINLRHHVLIDSLIHRDASFVKVRYKRDEAYAYSVEAIVISDFNKARKITEAFVGSTVEFTPLAINGLPLEN